MGTIFCNKCGKETDSSGRFCQWCGSNCEERIVGKTATPPRSIHVSSRGPLKNSRDNINEGDEKEGLTFFNVIKTILIFALFIIAVFLTLYVILLAFPTTSVIANITVTEKYPAHSYPSGKSTSINPPSVVDEKGNVYGVADQQLWGKLRINSTYTVRYVETGGIYSKTIDGAIVDGVTYTFQ